MAKETENRVSKMLWVVPVSAALGVISLAQAQSGSPFANKKKTQAWETAIPDATPPPPTYNQPTYTQPTYSQPTYSPPSYNPQSPSVPTNTSPTYSGSTYSAPSSAPAAPAQFPSQTQTPSYVYGGQEPGYAQPSYSSQTYTDHNYSGQNYSGQNYSGQNYTGQNYTGQNYTGQNYTGQAPSGQGYNQGYQGYNGQNYNGQAYYGQLGPNSGPGFPQQQKRRWRDRFGFKNLATSFSGYLKLGAAATDSDTLSSDAWQADFIGDAKIRGEVSAITQGGLEYGVGGEVRAQYDADRRGFGGLVGDCPAALPDCPSVTVGGLETALRGHTSQFYTSGPDNAEDFEVALEGAYVFLRSAYGDITVGRDDGSAYLFSLGAPTLVAVGASNSPVDYTGLDSVKTVNDASGFSEKITYTSPRLLGDQIGVGVQIGASYALNARSCGVDFCARRDDVSGALSPDLEDVIEVGIALDRTFNNGLSIEATGTYATASEQSGLAGFDDLSSFGLGLELGYGDWIVGASYLDSNNGLLDGDYTAYDIGLTWKPAAWGITAGYGHAEDENVNLVSDQGVLAFSYDFGNYRLGTGVQYIERTVPVNGTGLTVGTITSERERAGAIFVEGSVKF